MGNGERIRNKRNEGDKGWKGDIIKASKESKKRLEVKNKTVTGERKNLEILRKFSESQ